MDSCNFTEVYSFTPFKFKLVKPYPTSALPAPRSGHRIVCNSKYLYVFGGYNPDLEGSLAIQDMWRFNFATRRWKQCATDRTVPAAVVSAAAVRKRQQLLVYGGTGIPFGVSSSNELHNVKLNAEVGSFFTMEIHGDPPEPMYGQAMVVHKNNLFTIGGTTGSTFTCDVHRVDLRRERKVWKQLYPAESNETKVNGKFVPAGRYRHEVGYDNKNIYVLGGGTTINSYSLTDIPVFNIESRRWDKLQSKGDPKSDPSFPEPRKSHGAVQLKMDNNTYVFIMGGYQHSELVFNDLWRLELSTLQWTLMQSCILSKPLYFHSTSLTREGKMYSFGGIEAGVDLRHTNDIYTTWLYIPKLSEMCWEAILHYCQHVNLSKELLKGLKVPERFIERVD